jgi:hypothetical protein
LYACDTQFVLTCKGTVAVGQPVGTATVGEHTFEVSVSAYEGAIGYKDMVSSVTYTVVKEKFGRL